VIIGIKMKWSVDTQRHTYQLIIESVHAGEGKDPDSVNVMELLASCQVRWAKKYIIMRAFGSLLD